MFETALISAIRSDIRYWELRWQGWFHEEAARQVYDERLMAQTPIDQTPETAGLAP